MTVIERISSLQLQLPAAATAVGAYAPLVRQGSRVYLSGHLGRHDGEVIRGRVGDNLEVPAAIACARSAALELLASLAAAGLLEQVSQVVRLTGYVCCAPDFEAQSAVINGASELLLAVFGETVGRHARSAVGVTALPLGAAVEVEAIIQLRSGSATPT